MLMVSSSVDSAEKSGSCGEAMNVRKKDDCILIIDDEEGIRFSLRGILEDEGYTVVEAESGEKGLSMLNDHDVSLVFLDIWLPGIEGPEVLEKIKEERPQLPVLMISGHATIEHAVSAIKNGAHDFIEKPLSLEKVLIATERALEFQHLKRENQALRANIEPVNDDDFMGCSAPMRGLRDLMDRVAPLDTWVLITGENGTGKEVAAKYIHSRSSRAERPLVAVNCAAIPEELIESELFGHEKGAFTGADNAKIGKFELADHGTLFLDEIGDMSMKTQAKILRILQEQRFERVGGNSSITVDVRVIAATNKKLEEAIRSGEFREDLYYRLRVFPLHMPPLRERGDDITQMLDHFCAKLQKHYRLDPISFSEDARTALKCYTWPGNVRELKNFAERMLIMYAGKTITAAMLPSEIVAGGVQGGIGMANGEATGAVGVDTLLPDELTVPDFKNARNAFEKSYLENKLKEFDGNVSRMAEAIGMERSYLHRKLKSLGISD